MSDFLKAAKQVAVERIKVAGTDVEVRGLSTREVSEIYKGKDKDKDPEALTVDLIVACCFHNGKPLIPLERKAEVLDIAPTAFKVLSESVARVNGFVPGNSNATDGGSSSSD